MMILSDCLPTREYYFKIFNDIYAFLPCLICGKKYNNGPVIEISGRQSGKIITSKNFLHADIC